MERYYLIGETKLKSMLLQELQHVLNCYNIDDIGKKTLIFNQIKDFNLMIKDFKKKYSRDPIDDEELWQYVCDFWTIDDLKQYLIEEDMQKNYEIVEK